ncbi:MAG: hypothetical protein MUE81_17830 [Thermoflexibacter sp.]|jgi:hypothetical protein|nr:hypothetical protein [Thermoflexibacter sp.]
MAKTQRNKEKQYSEAELIEMFGLTRLVGSEMIPSLAEWTNATTTLSPAEQQLFDDIRQDAVQNIAGWQEEDLKMMFISFVLRLGHLRNQPNYHTYFEKTISATVEGIFLKTKTDFMIAKGILDKPKIPYFHFQEWKPLKNPKGDSMAQLLEAFLIAQETNRAANLRTDKPLYGCEVVGKQWTFAIMEGKTYCLSKSYDCTEKDDLLQIIAILRKFKEILETKLLS